MKYSFLICAYNAQDTIKRCLDSLVNQSFDKNNFEILLVNDGSTDQTQAIANSYKEVKVINQKNKGLAGARNTALDHFSGEWILYIDADDYASYNYLQAIDKAISENPDANFIKTHRRKDRKSRKHDKKNQNTKMENNINARAIHRSVIGNYRFPSKYHFAIEDWDFYVHNLHKLITKDISDKKDVYYYYSYTKGSLSKTNKIYKSRFEHALSIFEDQELRQRNLKHKNIGHYWEHLYMVGRLWHKDLMPRIQACRYKTKIRFSIRMQYWIVRSGFLNPVIKKLAIPVNK